MGVERKRRMNGRDFLCVQKLTIQLAEHNEALMAVVPNLGTARGSQTDFQGVVKHLGKPS